jgi:hypothetical protein
MQQTKHTTEPVPTHNVKHIAIIFVSYEPFMSFAVAVSATRASMCSAFCRTKFLWGSPLGGVGEGGVGGEEGVPDCDENERAECANRVRTCRKVMERTEVFSMVSAILFRLLLQQRRNNKHKKTLSNNAFSTSFYNTYRLRYSISKTRLD